MKGRLTKSRLAIILSKLEVFSDPKVLAEQYPMDSEIGAEVLWNAYLNDDIMGKVSADFGCGTGILGIGMMLLGAKKVVFIDKDKIALELAKKNLEKVKSEYNIQGEAEFKLMDISEYDGKVNTVIMNPPFGVKVRHADRIFLKKAFEVSEVIYSFHKSESKEFIKKYSCDNGFKVSDVWEFLYPLKASYEFHKKRIERINVSCFALKKSI